MSKHTETPWRSYSGNGWHEIHIVTAPVGARHHIVATLPSTYVTHSQWQANAEFIVRACNTHQQLVDALKMAKGIFADAGYDEALAQVCAALEAAGVTP